MDVLTASFLFWCGLSLAWTPDVREGALQFVNLVSLAIIFAGVQRAKQGLIPWVVSVAAVGALAIYHKWPLFWGGFGNENFMTEFLLIAAPWCLMAPLWLGLPAFLGSAYWLLFISQSDTVWAALAAPVAVVFLLLIRRSRRIHRPYEKSGLFWAAVLVLVPINAALLSGWATSHELLRALGARLELTYNTGAMWLTKPITGHGMGSFNYLFPFFQERHLKVFPGLDTTLRPMTVFAGAAHDEYIQALSELGTVGFLLAGAVVAVVGLNLSRRRIEWIDLVAAASCSMAATIMLVGFPLHNPYTALLIVFGLGRLASRGSAYELARERWPWQRQALSAPWGFWSIGRNASLPLLVRSMRSIRRSLSTATSRP